MKGVTLARFALRKVREPSALQETGLRHLMVSVMDQDFALTDHECYKQLIQTPSLCLTILKLVTLSVT